MDKIGKTSKPHAHKINVNEMKKNAIYPWNLPNVTTTVDYHEEEQ